MRAPPPRTVLCCGPIFVKTVVFGKVFKQLCLFAWSGSEQLKVSRNICWSGDFMHWAASQVHSFLNVFCQCGTQPRRKWKERSFLLSLYSTKPVYCICCGKSWWSSQRHWMKTHFSSGYSCCISMCEQPADVSWSSYPYPTAHFFPTSHLPDHPPLSSKWSLMNNQHCFVPDQ